MLSGYYATAYKSGVAATKWDITFDSTDFQNALANAYIDGPFSIIVDIDASTMAYPMFIGIELQGLGNTISVGDRAHIAFIANDGRHVVGPSSVPQLAYIDGVYNKIVIKCYGYVSADGPRCKVSLRLGPPAVISAPQAMIGRDTRASDPGIYFTVDSGVLPILATSVDNLLFSINANVISGIRLRIKGVAITLDPTPSYAGDLAARLEMVTDFATTEVIARIYSRDTDYAYYSLDNGLILPPGYTLRAYVDSNNSGVNYFAQGQVTYEEVY